MTLCHTFKRLLHNYLINFGNQASGAISKTALLMAAIQVLLSSENNRRCVSSGIRQWQNLQELSRLQQTH